MRSLAFPPADEDFEAAVRDAIAVAGTEPDARRLWRALADGGVLRACSPPGVRRPDLRRLARLVVALDAVYGPGLVLSACVPLASALPLLAEAARREAAGGPAGTVYRNAMSGACLVALAVTDADAAGSDLARLGCAVHADGTDVVLTGGKEWITNATTADHFLVLARRCPGTHFTSFSWVLVPASAPGVTVTPARTSLFAGAGLGDPRFDLVRQPAGHIVGGAGRAMASLTTHLATERLCGALWAAALVRRVLDETMRRLTAREVSGAPLVRHPVVRQRIGRCLVRYAQLAAVCRRIIDDGELDGPGAGLAAMVAKMTAADVTDHVLTECTALSGAYGFTAGGLHLLRAEAAMLGVAGGVTDLMADGVASYAEQILAGPVRPAAWVPG